MKKTILTFLIPFFIIVNFSCNGTTKNYKRVAILKYTTHAALDELENGYIEKISNIYRDRNDSLIIKKFNADGKIQNAKTIAMSLNDLKTDLIFVIGTPAAIQIANTSSEIPVIYGAVADPYGAKIIPSNRITGIQNAGENIIVDALKFMRSAFPSATKLGTIYNPSEQNSLYVQSFIEKHAKEFGFELKQTTINDISNITSSVDFLSNEIDVLYSSNDNTVNSGIGSIISICDRKRIPFVIGDLSTLKMGPLFAVGLEYYSMGSELAEMSFKILEGSKISEISPRSAPKPQIWFNNETKTRINYIMPNNLEFLINKTLY